MCYLFDYEDEWCFYIILIKKFKDESSQKETVVVKRKGKVFG